MPTQRNWAAAAKYLYGRFSGAMPTAPEYSFDNNKWVQERSADNTADINMIKVDASNNVVLGPGTNGTVSFASGGVSVPGNLTVTGSTLILGQSLDTVLTPASNNTAGAVNPIPNTSLINAVYQRNTAGAPRTDVTDTAANIVTALQAANPNVANNTSFTFLVNNVSSAANAVTISGGTNVTMQGNNAVANNTGRTFIGVVTNAVTPAVTLYAQGA